MYCTQCGLQINENDRFCSYCGKATAVGAQSGFANPRAAGPMNWTGPAKPFTRVREGAWLGGVCAGLARYWDMDPALVRILFVALALCPLLPAIIPYIVCWIIMPRDPLTGVAAYPSGPVAVNQ